MSSLLKAKNLHKSYTTFSPPLEVLCGIDLEVKVGESLAILGASGAGKSTLLHILGTLDKPDAGEVTLEGNNLFQLKSDQLCQFRNQTMGFVFQFHHLFPILTAQENAMLPKLISGESKEKSLKESSSLLSELGLGGRLHHRPDQLSGGEQQRVAIARALMMKPKILFADEPTGNLDSETSEAVMQVMLDLHRRYQTALILVTHNERLADRLSRKLWMKDGRLVAA